MNNMSRVNLLRLCGVDLIDRVLASNRPFRPNSWFTQMSSLGRHLVRFASRGRKDMRYDPRATDKPLLDFLSFSFPHLVTLGCLAASVLACRPSALMVDLDTAVIKSGCWCTILIGGRLMIGRIRDMFAYLSRDHEIMHVALLVVQLYQARRYCHGVYVADILGSIPDTVVEATAVSSVLTIVSHWSDPFKACFVSEKDLEPTSYSVL